MTVSDEEIAGALSLLVEYILDTVDPTPVWGDKDPPPPATPPTPLPAGTKFYPGAFTNVPTVLQAYPNRYQKKADGASSCGMTESKLALLGKLASAAADEAGTVSGLVHGSFGGVGFSIGAFAKFSFGDDQTLATIVKTAASRVAARVTVATVWPVLSTIQLNTNHPSYAFQ